MSTLTLAQEQSDPAVQKQLKVRTAVAGVTGYAGAELARLLLNHPRLANAQPLFLGRMDAQADSSTLYDLHPQLARNNAAPAPPVVPFTWQTLRENGTEILFLATPHEQSREWVPAALAAGMRIIDLSGAWRLQEPVNAAVYQLHDVDPQLAASIQGEAVYGSPELHRDKISRARLVANPGCYATSIILALAPLLQAGVVDLDHGIVCDAKSGVSGAGKAATAKTHFMHAADNLSAYAVFGHRHTGELLEQLHVDADQIQFTPHLLPIPRGILSTIYLRLKNPASRLVIDEMLRGFFATSPMVRVHRVGSLPQIQHVVRTAFCDIGFEIAPDGRRLVLVSCLDNLLKGAASQAVQNMNVMCGWEESEGLL
ncbi:MAG: N-acetyl-gamma-glutamyl-phosphate reductase [Janthinobacterium lividum]